LQRLQTETAEQRQCGQVISYLRVYVAATMSASQVVETLLQSLADDVRRFHSTAQRSAHRSTGTNCGESGREKTWMTMRDMSWQPVQLGVTRRHDNVNSSCSSWAYD